MSPLSFRKATRAPTPQKDGNFPNLRLVRHESDGPLPSSPQSPGQGELPTRSFDFERWHSQYRSLVIRLVHRSIHDYQKAEDLISVVWDKINRNGHRYNPQKGRETTFISCITKRTIIDFLRRARTQGRVNSNFLGESDEGLSTEEVRKGGGATGSVTPPAEKLVSVERMRMLLSYIDQLPDLPAGIIRRHYLAGQTLRQISEQDEIPLGTVKSALNRGLELLRARSEDFTK
jgi:RNA polymerase sigma-70 factor (ECF subfamily)